MPRLRACLLAACLVSSAFAESLTLAMAHLRDHDDGFDPHEPPTHTTDVKVGVYLEHLLDVSMEEHTFDMDFYFTLEWMDARNYSSLFSDPDLVESEPDSCVEQRNEIMKKNRQSRKMLSLPGGGDEDNDGFLPRKLAEDNTELIDAQVGEVVKFFNEFQGEGGTTYSATILSIKDGDNGKKMYEIEYVDESTHSVTRFTTIDTLSAMPQPARKFVEFGHDELKLIWKPDVHITNLHADMNVHEELLRVYDDGHVEFIRFVWTKLDMHEKVKIGHPVDKLILETHIASLSHSTERITLQAHPTMNGLEESLVSKWSAGWDHVDHSFNVLDKTPDYAHADSCRQEKRAMYIFHLDVSRPSAPDLTTKLTQLDFKATAAPTHLTDVSVGVFFEQVRAVDDKLHEFTSIFYTIYRWKDERDYQILLDDPNFLEEENVICSEGQHEIRSLDEDGNSLDAEHRIRRLSHQLESSRRRAGASPSASSSAGSETDGSNGSSGGPETPANMQDSGLRKFVEFGHDERKLLWTPDLHVVNQKGEAQIHSELMRIYENGWVEVIELQESVLEMLHPDYISFPFDSQGLNVEIESVSHSSNRVVLNSLDEMTGVEESMLSTWVAGWIFRSEDHHSFLRSPDYTHGSACRGETISRFDFHLVLEREGWKTVEQVLVPCTVLVLISFIAFFIDIKTLMPRIAVGFLTFLTMTNWEASTVETFASQEHPVWFIEFFKVMRLIVAMTLWQTCFSSFIGEKLSVRLSREIDKRARIVFFVDYVISVFTISAMPKDQAGVLTLNMYGYFNALAIMAAVLIWARVLHMRLQHALIYDPLTVFHNSTEDMDANEVAALYSNLDKNGDEQVTVETIVRTLMVDIFKNSGETNMAVRRKQEAELVALVKRKLAERGGDAYPLMHREAFEINYKSIFHEALAWKIRHDAMRKKRNSVMDVVGSSIRRLSSLTGSRKNSGTDVELSSCEVSENDNSNHWSDSNSNTPQQAVRKKKVSKNGFDNLDDRTPSRDSLPDYMPDQV